MASEGVPRSRLTNTPVVFKNYMSDLDQRVPCTNGTVVTLAFAEQVCYSQELTAVIGSVSSMPSHLFLLRKISQQASTTPQVLQDGLTDA